MNWLLITGVLKVGNLNFADGTGIFLFNNDSVNEAESSLTIAGSKTLTLAGNNYVKGSPEKEKLNINGEAGSKIVSNGNVNFEKILQLTVPTLKLTPDVIRSTITP